MKHTRVLVADNDRHLRAQLYTRLLDVDVFSDAVATGNEAIECLRDRDYSVVLLDLELTDRDVSSVIDYIRQLGAENRPIVLATASRSLTPDLDCDLVQIIIRKPVKIVELAEMIRSCVFGRSDPDAVARRAQRGDRDDNRILLQ